MTVSLNNTIKVTTNWILSKMVETEVKFLSLEYLAAVEQGYSTMMVKGKHF